MQTLIDTVVKIQQMIKAHKSALAKNETMTRYALIDPLLGELGWDLSNPGDVVPEDNTSPGGKTDYTLGNDAMIVEVEKLDENLDKYADRLISYVRDRNVRYGVLTNGQKWRMYDANTTTKSPEVEFDITDSDGVVLSKAIRLHRSVVLDGVPSSTHNPNNKVTRRRAGSAAPPRNALTDINYSKGDSPPKSLIHRDDSRKPLGSWVDLLAGVAEWLISNKRLTSQNCPVKLGSKNYLLHTEPTHPNGKPFSTHREIGGLYVFTNFDPSCVIRHAKNLIKAAGLNPSDFKVDWQDPPRKGG